MILQGQGQLPGTRRPQEDKDSLGSPPFASQLWSQLDKLGRKPFGRQMGSFCLFERQRSRGDGGLPSTDFPKCLPAITRPRPEEARSWEPQSHLPDGWQERKPSPARLSLSDTCKASSCVLFFSLFFSSLPFLFPLPFFSFPFNFVEVGMKKTELRRSPSEERDLQTVPWVCHILGLPC